MNYSESLKQFPVFSYLDSICETLKDSDQRAVVLTAETGAGKSTVLPVALLKHFNHKILMTEPRRIAAVGVADRVASLINEPCGKTVGYKIFLENKTSPETKLEVVTEAVLVRMLQTDPVLEAYDVVVLDEFHERSVDIDLSLAFLKEALELRDDLFVIVMSATIDSQRISEYLNGCPQINIPGRTFPVEIEYLPETEVSLAVEGIIKSQKLESGTVLAFLPGLKEIKKCAQELSFILQPYSSKVEVKILHSSIGIEDQKSILKPAVSGKIRIVISSSIAETSLTIPDVKIVVDSGFCRINKVNAANGMNQLVTQKESLFSAKQRCGRAGRIQEGICYRLWNKSENLVEEIPPEITRTDLVQLVLECSERGIFQMEKIDWLEKPAAGLWNQSVKLLKNLNFIDDEGHISKAGKTALSLGLNPRLAGIALCISGAKSESQKQQMLSLLVKYSQYSQSSEGIQKKFADEILRRIKNVQNPFENEDSDFPAVLRGFPDRVARRISEYGAEKVEYQFVSGRNALLHSSIKQSPQWICVPEVNLSGSSAVIFAFEELKGDGFEKWIKKHSEEKESCEFENGKIVKNKNICLGELLISSVKMPSSQEDFAKAWVNEVTKKGFNALPVDEKIENLLLRAEFYSRNMGFTGEREAFNFSEEQSLEEKLSSSSQNWLVPFITGNKLTSQMVYDGLYWFLEGSEIDRHVPQQLELSTGRKVRVKYERTGSTKIQEVIRPSVEIIIQRIFGCFETPRVMGIPVTLKLLSPASRPLQITQDLENFWKETWPEICKEMKGRYPKHNWDYRVAEKSEKE